MEILFNQLLDILSSSAIIKLTLVWICFDTVLGALRALKEGSFNSNFGIDGGIRKVSMILSLVFLAIADGMIQLNLIAFIPEDILQYLPLEKVGMLEFFGLLFVIYESISILKNMYLCGLPMPQFIKEKLEVLLKELTSEMPNKEK